MEAQKAQLNAPITKEEALLALKPSSQVKHPGRKAWLVKSKEFHHVLLHRFLATLKHSFMIRSLPQSTRKADIVLIFFF